MKKGRLRWWNESIRDLITHSGYSRQTKTAKAIPTAYVFIPLRSRFPQSPVSTLKQVDLRIDTEVAPFLNITQAAYPDARRKENVR
jgi:hypothetical protein